MGRGVGRGGDFIGGNGGERREGEEGGVQLVDFGAGVDDRGTHGGIDEGLVSQAVFGEGGGLVDGDERGGDSADLELVDGGEGGFGGSIDSESGVRVHVKID